MQFGLEPWISMDVFTESLMPEVDAETIQDLKHLTQLLRRGHRDLMIYGGFNRKIIHGYMGHLGHLYHGYVKWEARNSESFWGFTYGF